MRKLSLLLVFMLFSAAQLLAQRTITGMVTGDDGLGLPSVTVLVNGSIKQAAQTDLNGTYSIRVPANAKFLRFSFVGMKTQDVMLTPNNTLNVTLSGEASQIEGVVVMGYVSRSKAQSTGSSVQVSADNLKNSSTTSVDQALQGKVAGMAISSSSGTPGSVQQVRIRGAGSLTAGNDPLVVIDGVPVINDNVMAAVTPDGARAIGTSLSPLSAINSEDIESITVLKDASATSAYGARGSNGVIVIATKKGKDLGRTAYSFSAYYGIQNPAVKGRQSLTGLQREELLLEALVNSGIAPTIEKAKEYALGKNDVSKVDNVPYYKSWVDAGKPTYNWHDIVDRKNAPIFNVQASARGGDKVSNFYVSLGYNKTNNIIKGGDYNRINGIINYARNFTDKIKFSTNNTVSNVRQNGHTTEGLGTTFNPILQKYGLSPWISPYNEDGTPAILKTGLYNWLYLVQHDVSYNDYTRAINNTSLEWEFVKNLKFKTLVGLDYGVSAFKKYFNRHHGIGADANFNGRATENIDRNFTLVFQNSLNYNYKYIDHSFSATALMEYQKNKFRNLFGKADGFAADGLINLNSGTKFKTNDSNYTEWMIASYLGMFNYTYADRYVIDISFRREGSSKFPATKKFGNFWSVGLAWNIHNEEFFYKPDVVNNLKLRTSYGISGNSDIPINAFEALLKYDRAYGGNALAYPTGYGSPDLTWEKNRSFDIGIDYGFFKDRLNGSISYFDKLTTDLLQNVPLSLTTGFESILKNVGSISNTGIEAIMNIRAISKRDLNLTFNINFATLNNKVKKLATNADGEPIPIGTTNRIVVGQPINAWYMKKWAGVNPDNGNPQWYKNGESGEVTEDYIKANENVFQGSPIPKYTGGLGLQFDYNGLFLNASAYYAGGHKVYDGLVTNYVSDGKAPILNLNGFDLLMDRWREKGNVTDVPKQTFGDGMKASATSTRFLYKGDYIRLKDVTLGYNLPTKVLALIKYKGTVSVFAKGTNLFTFAMDKRMKFDPEVNYSGWITNRIVPIKSITFGINLTF